MSIIVAAIVIGVIVVGVGAYQVYKAKKAMTAGNIVTAVKSDAKKL